MRGPDARAVARRLAIVPNATRELYEALESKASSKARLKLREAVQRTRPWLLPALCDRMALCNLTETLAIKAIIDMFGATKFFLHPAAYRLVKEAVKLGILPSDNVEYELDPDADANRRADVRFIDSTGKMRIAEVKGRNPFLRSDIMVDSWMLKLVDLKDDVRELVVVFFMWEPDGTPSGHVIYHPDHFELGTARRKDKTTVGISGQSVQAIIMRMLNTSEGARAMVLPIAAFEQGSMGELIRACVREGQYAELPSSFVAGKIGDAGELLVCEVFEMEHRGGSQFGFDAIKDDVEVEVKFTTLAYKRVRRGKRGLFGEWRKVKPRKHDALATAVWIRDADAVVAFFGFESENGDFSVERSSIRKWLHEYASRSGCGDADDLLALIIDGLGGEAKFRKLEKLMTKRMATDGAFGDAAPDTKRRRK